MNHLIPQDNQLLFFLTGFFVAILFSLGMTHLIVVIARRI